MLKNKKTKTVSAGKPVQLPYENYDYTINDINPHPSDITEYANSEEDTDFNTTNVSISIIIDDLGWSMKRAEDFLEMDIPISLSILPHLPFSESIAEEAFQLNKDVLLHLPMEPKGYPDVNPGEGALTTKMTKEELIEQLNSDIKSVPYLIGVNNHMGSKLSEHEFIMKLIMKELRERDLLFIDSLTSSKSVITKLGKELGIKTGRRNVFLDNIEDVDYISGQLDKLIKVAKIRGSAIGIGHPHRETVTAINKAIAKFKKEGIEVIPISEMIQ